MPVIDVKNITKEYRLGALKGFKHTIQNSAARLLGKAVPERQLFKALDDVSFSVSAGEVVGIIGHNGAGKSTLLKVLAGITTPSRGSIHVDGRIAPLIEVGAGFVPDFTGRENVYLNGAILGMKRAEIDSKLNAIVDFAEMHEFMDTPVKRYSSGMQVRLAFAVATSIESEILIVDEVLAVGDLAFQRKCFDRMEDLIRRQGKTVLIVSHNIRQLERLCDRIIMLDHGRIVANGDPTEVSNIFFDYSNRKIKSSASSSVAGKNRTSEELTYNGIELLDSAGEKSEKLKCLLPFSVTLSFTANRRLERLCFLIGTHTTDFVYLTANNNIEDTRTFEPGTHTVKLEFEAMTLLPGVYSFRVWIGTPEGRESFYGENLFSFEVFSDNHLITRQQEMGLFYMPGRFNIEQVNSKQGSPQLTQGDHLT